MITIDCLVPQRPGFSDLYDPFEGAQPAGIQSSVPVCGPDYLPDHDPNCICIPRPDGIIDVL